MSAVSIVEHLHTLLVMLSIQQPQKVDYLLAHKLPPPNLAFKLVGEIS
jgi:hypothetical protein